MLIIKKLKAKAKKLMLDLVVLHLACQNSKTPWTAKALIVIILGYALSPIDLIPDFIPILGLLDDLILLPLGIYLAIKLIPKEVLETSRILAKTYQWERKKSVIAVLIIALIWIGIAYTTINLILYNKY